jgi:hypothetical protein
LLVVLDKLNKYLGCSVDKNLKYSDANANVPDASLPIEYSRASVVNANLSIKASNRTSPTAINVTRWQSMLANVTDV